MIRYKKGQFFLIAAIVRILIVLGFYGVRNSIKGDVGSNRIYDLKDELNVESASVVDYGLYSNNNTKGLLDDFTNKYSSFTGSGKNLYFVFGDEREIIVKGQEEVLTGSVGVQIGETTTTIPTFENRQFRQSITGIIGNKVTVKVGEQSYDFTLNPNQNFYFVISQETGGGKKVVQG